jgi:hypothetical protein
VQRRKTILAAAAVAGTFLVGAAALTANADLLKSPGNDNVGQISPVSASPTTIYLPAPQDATVQVPAPTAPSRASGEHEHETDHNSGERDD